MSKKKLKKLETQQSNPNMLFGASLGGAALGNIIVPGLIAVVIGGCLGFLVAKSSELQNIQEHNKNS
ncbi:MAG: hypothetical protein PQ612_02695 [Rickettsiales bacterium]|nr:hypothetical protein [Pseudomonadota bacterium]MDA0965978.1 hypothetical protein [Pseudomonadota bacterium]MDG4542551.1 hypothetical protein [Rickettsiales bacterium]MDG4545055.1 hypothetical protein [Rickettsiales bacterium]MDG4547178.1 hypothetical protein [Rickettsiales bacterium]